jgi:hypothetical protein
LKSWWKNKKISKKGPSNKKDGRNYDKGSNISFLPFVKARRDEFPDLIKDKRCG